MNRFITSLIMAMALLLHFSACLENADALEIRYPFDVDYDRALVEVELIEIREAEPTPDLNGCQAVFRFKLNEEAYRGIETADVDLENMVLVSRL